MNKKYSASLQKLDSGQYEVTTANISPQPGQQANTITDYDTKQDALDAIAAYFDGVS